MLRLFFFPVPVPLCHARPQVAAAAGLAPTCGGGCGQVDGLSKTERDVSKLTRQLKEVEEAVGRHKAARREVKRLQAAAAEHDAGLRELAAQEQSLRRQADSAAARAADLENRSGARPPPSRPSRRISAVLSVLSERACLFVPRDAARRRPPPGRASAL